MVVVRAQTQFYSTQKHMSFHSNSILLGNICLSTSPEVVKLVLHGLNSGNKNILFDCTLLKMQICCHYVKKGKVYKSSDLQLLLSKGKI